MAGLLGIVLVNVVVGSVASGQVRIGGWDKSRGGFSWITKGDGQFGLALQDLHTFFPGYVLRETPELTPAFLDTIDALLISVVYDVQGVQVKPLSAAEQTALSAFVSRGGRALLITDNVDYYSASSSFVQPFGLHVASAFIGGAQLGTITHHVTSREITDGRWGRVSTFRGDYVAYYDVIWPATALGRWNTNSQAALGALEFDAGRVVFFGDSALANGGGSPYYDNDRLRRNVLGYLVLHAGDLNCDGRVDFDDIDPFVVALSGEAAYKAKYPNCYWLNADCNCDGKVDFNDVDPFVALLGGS